MPDIFVPLDTLGFSDYLMSVRNRGLLYRYSLEYTEEKRTQLGKMSTVPEIQNYLKKNQAFKSFIRYAATKGVPANQKEITISQEILETQLYSYIIRNILDNEGFYPAIEPLDNTLLKAIEVIDSTEELTAKR